MTTAATKQSAAAEVQDDEAYRLLSVDAVRAPEGCTGRDWFLYKIQQGPNGITGYRQGTLAGVRAEAETIVAALNERRIAKKGKPNAKVRGRTPAASDQAEGAK